MHFTTYIKLVLPQIRLLTVLNVAGKILNSPFQLVLQQCCKTSCTLLLPVLPKLILLLFAVHKKPLREVEIAAICHDALQVLKKIDFFMFLSCKTIECHFLKQQWFLPLPFSLPIFCEQMCAMIIDPFGSDDSLANTKTLMTAFSSVMYQNLMVPDVFDAFKVY